MKHKILVPTILLILFVSSSLVVKASETEAIMPVADTYVDAWKANSAYGKRDHLEVSDHASGLSIIVLMFDLSKVSHVLNASSEIKLRLYCFDPLYHAPPPHVVGVHWCVNNTWNEENLTFASFGGFFRTNPGDVVRVDSIDVWYEWKVTDFVRKAKEEDYEKITLTLEVEDPLEGIARSLYASKDQPTEYSPQLVFTYFEPKAKSIDTIIIVAFGLTVTVAIAFLAYKFSKRSTRKTQHHKTRARS